MGLGFAKLRGMLKISLLSLLLSLSFSLQAGAVNSCAQLYTPVKKSILVKTVEALRGQKTVWGKENFQQLQAMTREYKIQLQRGVPLENIRLSNNSMIKETLDWMITRLENAENPDLLKDVGALRHSDRISYQEFLRVSHDFGYHIEGRKEVDLAGRFKDVTTSNALKEFFLLPSQMELTAVHLNEMMAEGIMPLGLVDRDVVADGKDYTPSHFFSHDLGHASAGAGRLSSADFAKFREAYWSFKSKLQKLSKQEQHIYENFWFLLTHELYHLYPGEKTMLRVLRDFNRTHGDGLYLVLFGMHDKNSDLQKMPKDEFLAYARNFEKIMEE